MVEEATWNAEIKSYTIYDEQVEPVFHIYFLSNHFKIVILCHVPGFPLVELSSNATYIQYAQLYKKASSSNFQNTLYQVRFTLNYYIVNEKTSTTKYQISTASFSLLKK